MCGRNVEGPMETLRKLWSGEVPSEKVVSTYQYVTEIRGKLEQRCNLAHEDL